MSSDSRLQDLLDRWEEARERGQAPSPEELCAQWPELLPEFKRQIERLQSMDYMLQTATLTQSTGIDVASRMPPGSLADDINIEITYGQLRFLARGGLGAVYVAGDKQLHRDVAIKFINERHLEDEESRARFVREAEITGRLEHPGIVPVHGIGVNKDGRPFYVMRFIQGETLEAAIRRHHKPEGGPLPESQRSLEFRNLLNRFVSVCNTMAYAHNRGIIHRDIKPDNIMLGRYGETLLVDWGLAMPVGRDRRARASGEMTLMPQTGSGSGNSSGSGAGTPGYMSPEQAEARLDLGPASDIYSLGSTFYKILTGEGPYQGQHPLEIMGKVRQGHFQPPGRVKKNVPRPLEAICLKAMAFRSEERYTSALEIAADIEHWLADEPVGAYQEPFKQKMGRWARRHRNTMRAGVAGLFALIALASLSAVWLGNMAGLEREARQSGLQLSARFAARTVANEIDLRWRILELEAKDPDLLELIKQPDGPEVRAKLHAWLKDRFYKHDKTAKAGTWFVDDDKGTIRAIFTENLNDNEMTKVVGSNFAYRDYFHGKGYDLKPEEAKDVKPLTDVHRSDVFLGKLDDKLKVAFSVPIKDRDQVIGVLIMTVELGRFAVLQTELGQNRFAVLVDTEADFIEGARMHGLVLHHRQIRDDRVNGNYKVYRLGNEQIEKFRRLRALRLREENEVEPHHTSPELDRNYVDPAAEGVWLAAAEPVIIPGRRGAVRDTGWIVIVQERK